MNRTKDKTKDKNTGKSRSKRSCKPARMSVRPGIDIAVLRDYWLKSLCTPMDALRAGAVFLDIECVASYRPRFVDGHMKGRMGGTKEWLGKNAPYIPYQSAMRYKHLAKLYGEALKLAPELPVEWFLPDCTLPAESVNAQIRQFADALRANKDLDQADAEERIARVGTFTDESLAALRTQGKVFFERTKDCNTAGLEGVTRRLYAYLHRYRAPVGPLRRSSAVLAEKELSFTPSKYRDRAYDTPEGRKTFAIRAALRRMARLDIEMGKDPGCL